MVRRDSLGQAAKDHTSDLIEKGRVTEIDGSQVLLDENLNALDF